MADHYRSRTGQSYRSFRRRIALCVERVFEECNEIGSELFIADPSADNDCTDASLSSETENSEENDLVPCCSENNCSQEADFELSDSDDDWDVESTISSSDSDDCCFDCETDLEKPATRVQLAQWVIRNQVKDTAVAELLCILKPHPT